MHVKKIKTAINTLKEKDIYSLLLFILYKMRDLPEQSSLSELAFILDKDNLFKLCEYYGGTTITIPTIQDLEVLTYCLVLYQEIHINNLTFDEALKTIEHNNYTDIKKIRSLYYSMSDILEDYKFEAGN